MADLLTVTVRDDGGKAHGILVLTPKLFKSGKVGFFGQGKIEIDGRRYQAQTQLVALDAGEPESLPDEAGDATAF